MKQTLLFTLLSVFSLSIFAQNDIFISEYIEGSGNNKAIELYNPTDHAISLSAYILVRFSNGEGYPSDPKTTNGGYLQLQGTINAGECFVIVNGQTEDNEFSPACSPELQALADQLDHDYPAPTYMNGNDALAILKDNGSGQYIPVDLFGQIGVSAMNDSYGWSYVKDSTLTYTMSGNEVTATITDYIVPLKANDHSTSGPFWMAWSKDHSLIRKPNVTHGVTQNPTLFSISEEWDTLPAVHQGDTIWTYKDIWTNLGHHTYGTGISEKTSGKININVYPNPVTDNSFSVSSVKTIKSVLVYNVIGKVIYSAEDLMTKSVAVYLDNPSKGIYMVMTVFDDNTTSAHKVIIK